MPMKYVSTAKVLTITDSQGEVHQVDKNHTMYDKVMKALKENDEKKVLKLVDKMKEAVKWAGPEFERKGNKFFYKGKELHNVVTAYIGNLMDLNVPANRFIKFLENLMSNPSENSRNELWQFLQACQMPLDAEGNIIAYKWVDDNYKDCHSGRFLNKPGSLIEMPREKCDDDRNRECSTGFHACSRNYMKFGSRLMEVRINPRDVVSVPRDYNASKMRVCRYVVLCEVGVENYEKPPTSLAYDATHPIHEFEVNDKAEVKKVTKKKAKQTLKKAPPIKEKAKAPAKKKPVKVTPKKEVKKTVKKAVKKPTPKKTTKPTVKKAKKK